MAFTAANDDHVKTREDLPVVGLKRGLSPHFQNHGFMAGDGDRLSRAMRQQRAGQR